MDKMVVWKEQHGKPYLSIDLRHLDREGQITAIEGFARAVEDKPEASVAVLVLASEFEFFPEVVTKARAIMLQHQSKTRRSALVNMGGILKIAFDSYYEVAKLLGMVLNESGQHFKTEEEALVWLLRD
jgi:hypothetical protein